MKVVYGINNLKKQYRPSVVSVGIFDGVHIGHQSIIKELNRQAHALKAEPTVVTFDPHPLKILEDNTAVAMLASLSHRLNLLNTLGIKLCLVIRFNKDFARMGAIEFIKNTLIDKLNMKILIVGENFSFGKERLHSRRELKTIADKLGFKLKVMGPKKHHSRVISSSVIRHLIERGKLNTASRLLGRPVSILGTVIRGRQRGRVVGFRTANIDPHHEAIPPSGVYAVYSRLEGKIYKSVLNIGTRPTFGEKEPSIEVHLFGLNKNLYGKDIEICFKKKLRQERRFRNKEHLRAQIMKDAALAKSIL
jgi:riboflavin kinase/FMN adenylyltransferase